MIDSTGSSTATLSSSVTERRIVRSFIDGHYVFGEISNAFVMEAGEDETAFVLKVLVTGNEEIKRTEEFKHVDYFEVDKCYKISIAKTNNREINDVFEIGKMKLDSIVDNSENGFIIKTLTFKYED